jgi:hypothetical protein
MEHSRVGGGVQLKTVPEEQGEGGKQESLKIRETRSHGMITCDTTENRASAD